MDTYTYWTYTTFIWKQLIARFQFVSITDGNFQFVITTGTIDNVTEVPEKAKIVDAHINHYPVKVIKHKFYIEEVLRT